MLKVYWFYQIQPALPVQSRTLGEFQDRCYNRITTKESFLHRQETSKMELTLSKRLEHQYNLTIGTIHLECSQHNHLRKEWHLDVAFNGFFLYQDLPASYRLHVHQLLRYSEISQYVCSICVPSRIKRPMITTSIKNLSTYFNHTVDYRRKCIQWVSKQVEQCQWDEGFLSR